VLNLSLVWRADGGPGAAPRGTEAIYRALCEGLVAALARLGLPAAPQAVSGSFCDGRFNLAVAGRKLVGTAQSWRRVAGRPVVLAHAVIVVDADPVALTEAANDFERDLGSGRHYRAEALTSVAQAWQHAHGRAAPADLEAQVITVLAEQFARMLAPREVHV
jgi:lipoate-protein ligase A